MTTAADTAADESIHVTVLELRWEAAGVVSVRLGPEDGALPGWEPGAHVDVVLPNRIVRQYSLVESAPDLRWYRVAVQLDPESRGGSEYIHRFLRPGQQVRVRGPRNHFPMPKHGPLVLVGGGIGITPLLAMLRSAQAHSRPWSLHYGGRSRGTMAFLPELEPYRDRVRLWPSDETGLPPLDEIVSSAGHDSTILACGPGAMLDAVGAAVARSGIPEERLQVERFKARPRPPTVDAPVLVRAARSEREVLVDENTSLLDGLLRAGVRVSSSCRNGVCGTCEVAVLAGVPDHRDDVLTQAQQAAGASMLVCVSRAVGGEVTLDV
ncbi:MAG: hypothetical protein ABS81_03220 [Pseudonocardia sp. SCN 72-86]|nr:MAG: hypothetical protein ABS81_03220 [Pseudonocardia sp. SCN 72-86]